MSDKKLSSPEFKPKNNSIEYPLGNLINGPIADALTNIGQIAGWRRIAGHPLPKKTLF